MANLTATIGLDMTALQVSGLLNYDFSTISSTLIHLYDDATHFAKFTGSGFAVNGAGAITAGTLTGLEYSEGVPVFAITGASVPAVEFYNYVLVNNTNGAFSALLAGNDSIAGSSANDRLLGYTGNDVIAGARGNDTLDGGSGVDLAAYSGKARDYEITVSGSTVVVRDLNPADGDEGTDVLSNFERFGFADAVLQLGDGSAGDDLIDLRGPGGGTVEGGTGNDTYVVDDLLDNPVELLGGGIDTVQSSISWVLGDNFENLVLTGTADLSGTGNALANSITGNSGRNTLDGGAGADTLSGGAGGDTYFIDDPGDRVIESATANAAGGPVAALAGASWKPYGLEERPAVGPEADADADADTIVASLGRAVLSAFVENGVLAQGSAAREMIGNALANTVDGNSASNFLEGGEGNDTLTGGAGMDVAAYAGKRDGYTITVTDSGVTVTDTNAADGNEGIDTLTGIEALRFSDQIYEVPGETVNRGTAQVDILRLEGDGAQIAAGGAGNDTYIVDAPEDAVVERSNEGKDTVKSSVSWTLWENLENLVLTGSATIDGVGNGGRNKLTGNSAANQLTGYGGNDTLIGGGGIDTLLGGSGDDTYVVGKGDITIERSGEGTDRIKSSVSWTLAANIENLTLTGRQPIDGTGTSAANKLVGNAASNVLEGAGGNDTLTGRGGSDVLAGGGGNDKLSGGSGADAFLFDTPLNASSNKDTISDFTPGDDTLQLDRDVFAAIGEGPLSDSAFRSGAGVSSAADADDRIIYNTSSGALYYDADGKGGAAPIQFAVLSNRPDLEATDFVIVA